MAKDEKSDGDAGETGPKARKLVLTKRVLRQFGVRSGVQTGLNDYGEDPGDPTDPNQTSNYQPTNLYRGTTTTYYG